MQGDGESSNALIKALCKTCISKKRVGACGCVCRCRLGLGYERAVAGAVRHRQAPGGRECFSAPARAGGGCSLEELEKKKDPCAAADCAVECVVCHSRVCYDTNGRFQ